MTFAPAGTIILSFSVNIICIGNLFSQISFWVCLTVFIRCLAFAVISVICLSNYFVLDIFFIYRASSRNVNIFVPVFVPVSYSNSDRVGERAYYITISADAAVP